MDIDIKVFVTIILLALLPTVASVSIKGVKESNQIIWVGKKHGLFSATRPKLWAFVYGRQLFFDAYFKYSSKDVVAKISTISTPLVMVPNNMRQWFFEQGPDILDHRATGFDAVESSYTMPCGYILDHPTHVNIIKKNLTRELRNITSNLVQEVEDGLLELWGCDTENWRDVDAWDTVMTLVTRTFNRISVDRPLCESKPYLSNTRSIHAMSAIIRMLPGWAKPLMGRIFSLPCWYYYWRGKRFAMPLIHTLLAQTESGQFSNQPNVFVSWIIQDALRTKNMHDIQPQTIYARLMTMNFAGIHTSSFTTVNFLLDSLARPDIFEDVKSEVFRIYSQQNRTWTKAAVDELRLTDQVLRESMRLSGPIVRLIRQVKAEVGAELNGVVLPKGTKIAVDMHNMHHDDNIYDQAHTLNPRRGDHLTDKILPAATKTSEIFLPFGHGRNACPGRFFASHEIKIIFAIITLRYDIEYLKSRLPNKWMGDSLIPPHTKLRVKRRPISHGTGLHDNIETGNSV